MKFSIEYWDRALEIMENGIAKGEKKFDDMIYNVQNEFILKLKIKCGYNYLQKVVNMFFFVFAFVNELLDTYPKLRYKNVVLGVSEFEWNLYIFIHDHIICRTKKPFYDSVAVNLSSMRLKAVVDMCSQFLSIVFRSNGKGPIKCEHFENLKKIAKIVKAIKSDPNYTNQITIDNFPCGEENQIKEIKQILLS